MCQFYELQTRMTTFCPSFLSLASEKDQELK